MNRILDNLSLANYPRVQSVAQYTGYVLFFLMILAIAVPATFPTRQLRGYLSREATARGYPLEIEALSLRGLGGLVAEGVQLTLPGKEGVPGENGQVTPGTPSAELRLDKLTARVALLPLIFGKTVDVSFDVEAGGGVIEDGRFIKKGEVMDLEIGRIAELSLAQLGVGRRALASQQQLSGELDGELGGTVKIHYGGTTDDLVGSVDLALADAVLRQPELALQGGLKLTDLAMGDVTLKVKMNLKANIAALVAQRGSEKATVIHIERMEALGDQLELVTEETSHILIPPGKAGWKAATIQLHFAFALPEKKGAGKDTAKPAGKDAAGKDVAAKDLGGKDGAAKDSAASDRLRWSQILTFAGKTLKPFERNGFIGIGCTGPLTRPLCRPELPQVTVGTRGKAEGGALPRAPEAPRAEGEAPPPAGDSPGSQPSPDAPVDFRPAVRPEPAAEPPPPEAPAAEAVPAEPPRETPPGEPRVEPRGEGEGRPPAEGGERPPPERPAPPPQQGEAPPPGDNTYDEEMPKGPRGRQDPGETPPEGEAEPPEEP